jgi:hypothetical protein
VILCKRDYGFSLIKMLPLFQHLPRFTDLLLTAAFAEKGNPGCVSPFI